MTDLDGNNHSQTQFHQEVHEPFSASASRQPSQSWLVGLQIPPYKHSTVLAGRAEELTAEGITGDLASHGAAGRHCPAGRVLSTGRLQWAGAARGVIVRRLGRTDGGGDGGDGDGDGGGRA